MLRILFSIDKREFGRKGVRERFLFFLHQKFEKPSNLENRKIRIVGEERIF